ncbi:MAG: hypothetical protein ACR2NL_07245 [Acidimicrobiia bacterium]
MWVLALTGQIWIFALLFIVWAVIDIATGESVFIQRVTRAQNPVAFWAIVVSWLALAVLWILYPA